MESTIQTKTRINWLNSTGFVFTKATRIFFAAAVFLVAGSIFWATTSLAETSASIFSQYPGNQSTYGSSQLWTVNRLNTSVADDFNAVAMVPQAPNLSLLPGDAAIAPAAGDQTAPTIAQGGNLLLAVWTDNRPNPYFSGIFSWSEYETSRDIYGVRLDTAGNVLDAVPLAIVARRSNQNYPKVSWNGSNWLVVYQSVDVGGTGYYQDSLEAVRVSPAGQVLDDKPIKLHGLTASGTVYWALASDGNNWVVVNQGNSTSSDIVAVRISAAGVVLDPPTRALVPATYYMRSNIQLAYSGGVFLCTFNDNYNNGSYESKAVRFDSNLDKLDAGLIAFVSTPLSALAGNGTGFYTVWNGQGQDGFVHVVGSRVNTAGAKLDGNGVNISGARQPVYGSITAVVWDGVNWRVTWSDLTTPWIARVSTAGVVLDPGSVAVAGVQTGSTTGNGAGALQVVWIDDTNNSSDIFTANISPGNVAGPSRALSVGAPRQTQPDIATNGNGYMMVYRSATSTQGRVLAQPLDAAGNPLTAEPVQLDSGLNINGPGNPNVAWNGSLYLVSWSAPNGIVAQRLSATGTKLDAVPFMVMSGAFGSADVAALGSNFLVTGLKIGINIQYIGPVAARVSGAGAVLDASPLFLGISYVGGAPAVVALGGRWLTAWHRNATHDNSSCNSIGAFIDAGGTVTPEFQIHGPFSTNGGNGIFEVGLASSGNTALFVQSQELTSGVENDLLARVIDVTGVVGPVINLTPWSGNQYRPRVAWDGANFIVTYQDQKNSLAEQSLEQLDARSDLFAMRVTPTGTVVDPQGFVFSALPTGETDPAVVSLNGVTMLAGSVVLNDTTFANYRIVYEQLDATLNKWPVAVANAAPTGGDVPLTVSFSSAGSGDLDGTIAGYFWDFGDGTTATIANPSHTYTVPGPFVATLKVIDNGGAQTTQTVLVKAVAPNRLPVAVARAVPMSGPPPLDVIFYADGSYDPDGFIGNVQWDFGDGSTNWGSPAYHTFSSAGTYTATLTVYDSSGATGTASLVVLVGTQPPQGRTAFDYDGDHKADISVFRPSTGAWYLLQSQAGIFGMSFGVSTDKITPADFDGDGKTDIAVYRPAIGIWYVFNSSNSTILNYSFGIAEDLPAPGDFDGDGKADLSVFRPSTGTWYRRNSSSGALVSVQFGASGDKPTIGDFDGDGRADIAVYRPSNGGWYRLNSSNGLFVGKQFGISTDLIVPADYDGDGKTDAAVYRPSTGFWYINFSSNGSYSSTQFGIAEDKPVPADYDRDGKADLAVYRPSNGTWYLLRSTAGFTAQQFGNSTDVPTPNSFVR